MTFALMHFYFVLSFLQFIAFIVYENKAKLGCRQFKIVLCLVVKYANLLWLKPGRMLFCVYSGWAIYVFGKYCFFEYFILYNLTLRSWRLSPFWWRILSIYLVFFSFWSETRLTKLQVYIIVFVKEWTRLKINVVETGKWYTVLIHVKLMETLQKHVVRTYITTLEDFVLW